MSGETEVLDELLRDARRHALHRSEPDGRRVLCLTITELEAIARVIAKGDSE